MTNLDNTTPLPNCFEAEQSLLGTLLAHPNSFTQCQELKPEDFFEPVHSRFFAFIADQINKTGKVLPSVIVSQFRSDESLVDAKIEASAYVASLVASQEGFNTVQYLARRIKNDSALRSIHSVSTGMIERVLKPDIGASAVDIAGVAVDEINAIAQSVETDVKQTRFSVLSVADKITSALNETLQHGVLPTGGAYSGTKEMHRVFNGWQAGKYYVIAGRPGMGKTSVASSLLVRTAGKKSPVLFFSLEMGATELTQRILADVAYDASDRIEYESIDRHEVTPSQFERILQAQIKLESAEFIIDDRANPTLPQIRAKISREKQRLEDAGMALAVVAIDHIGLVRASERYSGNKVTETEEISIGLKAIAKDFGVAVVAMAQMNRGSEAREDKRPALSDLRWSGSIEQDADVVMFCYRPAYYLERQKCDDEMKEVERLNALDIAKNKLEIIVAKHRGGKCPNIEMFCDIGCCALRDLIK
jgi:replicative DNA helicase